MSRGCAFNEYYVCVGITFIFSGFLLIRIVQVQQFVMMPYAVNKGYYVQKVDVSFLFESPSFTIPSTNSESLTWMVAKSLPVI